ncbi:MAG: serine/threonine-protein kinase, partial [Thermoanaerobaculia bacterium]
MPLELPIQIGPYRAYELIGQAGATAVYKAADPQGRTVAVKLFPPRVTRDPAAVERFHREIQAFAPVSRHPHLVHVLETGQHEDRLFVAMEYVPGTSLDRVLRQRRLSVQESFAVLRGICRGLAHAHEHGFLHRRLTPRNVLVSEDFSRVEVSDAVSSSFEVVTDLSSTANTGEISLAGLYYQAPEQVEGEAADHRADLYSAGVIFHEMLTGRKPGPKFGLPSQLNAELPSEVDVVVLKCLARKPSERYATAHDLLADLARLEETLRLRVLTEIRGISQAGSRLLGGGTEDEGKKRPVLIYLGIGLLVVAVL